MTTLNITYPNSWNALLIKHFKDAEGLGKFIKVRVKQQVMAMELQEAREAKEAELLTNLEE